MSTVITLTSLKREFPDWDCYIGTDQMYHARHKTIPDINLRGEDMTDLRDELIKWVRLREDT